jgi:isopenicillin-N epimerase
MTHALPPRSPLADRWTLSPGLVFLNHGSFGATPRSVQDAQSRFRAELEADPVAFFVERLWPLMDRTRRALADFVHADPACLAPVSNATVGVATALHNARLGPGEEVLINDHEYPACCNNARLVAARRGATVVCAELPFPMTSPDQAYDAIMAKVTPRTRVALISHITSSSGARLPVERLVPELNRRGIETLVDGAHVPGHLPLDISALRPTYYTANCHKWVCSPKGSAFLYVDPSRRDGFRPVILSNNAEKPRPGRDNFFTEFDFVGTGDPTPILAIPDALEAMSAMLPGGWPAVMAANQALLRRGRDILCEALDVRAPLPDAMLGNLCTIPLPAHAPDVQARVLARPSRRGYHDALQDALLERWKIQVPVWNVAGKTRIFRISAQLYNTAEQFAYLATALKAELAEEAKL